MNHYVKDSAACLGRWVKSCGRIRGVIWEAARPAYAAASVVQYAYHGRIGFM